MDRQSVILKGPQVTYENARCIDSKENAFRIVKEYEKGNMANRRSEGGRGLTSEILK